MGKVPDIIPITDLRRDAASVLKRINGTKEPVIITQRGRASAVMMSTDAYEKAEHDRQLSSPPRTRGQGDCRREGV